MWKADKLGYRGNTNYNRAYEGDELVWEKQQPGPIPPDNEIWYTSTDGNIVTPYSTSALPYIVSNTYVDGKGIIKFVSNITSIGSLAFRYCSSLTSIEIPNSITSIGNNTFDGCISLVSITIPDSVTSIGVGAFYNCYVLTSITIPDSVTSIGNGTFFGCHDMSSVTIGNSVTSIGNVAFFNCNNLRTISYTGTIAQYKTITKGDRWCEAVPATVVHCTDGDTPI